MFDRFNLFENEGIWRWLLNFWTVIFFVFIFYDYFQKDAYSFLVVPFSIIYTGLLTIYVGTKEFDRWYESHKGGHPGEYFVIAWTIVMALLIVLSVVFGKEYHAPSDIIPAVYIAVLSLFALTQKSKSLYRKRKS